MSDVIVVGTGGDWQAELDALLEEHSDLDIIAVNLAIEQCPETITHGVTKHPDLLEGWLKDRKEKVTTHAHEGMNDGPNSNPDHWCMFNEPWMKINSGNLAIKVALSLGYEKIYIAGLPFTHPHTEYLLRRRLSRLKKEFKNVIVPDHYWWKECVQ